MAISATKKARGRPRVESEDVHVRIAQPLLSQLDAWIAAQPEPKPKRPEALRRLMAERFGEAAAPLADQIKAKEEKIDALPSADHEPSPEAGMNTMRRALAENQLVELKNIRRRAKKPVRR